MINKGTQTLKGKDVQTFKSLAKFYDAKNFKKGLKTAEKLLETQPDHPETLALKALFQLSLNQEDKALQTAKTALFKSKFSSLLCWHTYGTIWKSKKNFSQAAKCFQNAVKLDPNNLQLLREYANLCIQIRDHSNHITMRYNILKQKPNLIQHWIGFVLSYHLKGDWKGMFKTLQSLQSFVLGYQMKPIQTSHYHLYRVLCFRDAQNYEGMKNQLTKHANTILDKIKWRQHMLYCCQKLGDNKGANSQITALVTQFPENIQYLQQFQKMLGLEEKTFYRKMNEQFKSKISKIMELRYTEDQEQFKAQFSKFIKNYYKKNLPSLFKQIQVLYSSEDKQKWIGQIFENFQKSLSQGKYPDGQQIISPSEYLWAMFMLSQHYSVHFNTLQKAYDFINKAINHTNTVSEMYIVKAQIQYKLHNNFESLKTINQARKTDLADRYMNNICVKFLMKCKRTDTAQQVLRLFMKDQANLYELQNQWYIIEAGKSFLKDRKFGPGLKHLDYIQKQFIEMYANQYDFHTYCIRKWTLSQYVQLIHYNDNIYQDKKYIEAAGSAIPYLMEYDQQLKNPKNMEQKQEKKQQQVSKKKKKNKKKAVNQVQELTPLQAFRKRLDYYGKEYMESLKQPLKEAFEWANNSVSAKYINKNNKNQNKLYAKAFGQSINIFIEFKKPLLVIKALKKLRRTNECKFNIHLYTMKSLLFLQKASKQAKDDLIKEIIDQFIKQLLGQSKTIIQFNQLQTKSWKQSQTSKIKIKQLQVVLKGQDKREQYVKLYLSELARFINLGNKITSDQLQMLFYTVHRLEFYGELDQKLKTQLQQVFATKTTYFGNWNESMNNLPPSTWSQWWLSEYDQQRQQIDIKQKQQKEKLEKSPQITETTETSNAA